MEADLLLKEDEYYKENEKIELKTKILLQKANDVMKIQETLIKDSLKTKSDISEVRKNNYINTKKPTSDESIFCGELFGEDTNPNNNPDNTSGVLRIYRAKLKNLVAEKERLYVELRQKSEEIKKLQKENLSFKEEKEKWFLSYNNGKINIGKLENQLTNVNSKLQSKETENACLRKEVEQLKRDLKSNNLNFNNCEVRLTRATEENEKLKQALKHCKDEEKDLKEGYRKQLTELTSTVKNLEKQKVELLNGFKKQMQLIDVLKKQKMHLEAYKIGEMTEGEYLKILDWKFE
ncbi:testis-expressed protein 9 [Anthonomus grandis grandis]|uniref:testis-expressed protein 9 n=1 Tax=Anthonomus grandis grandis TaxID=2921223 RepID=UPI002166B36E|nr:testis-expressed protein 9 [Anthonomus grandis grandis]